MKTGPAFPRTRKYDGIGGYATNSHDIPIGGLLAGIVFLAGFVGAFWLLAWVGF